MNTKSIMIFFGGMVSGAAAGVLAVRTYYKKKYEKDHAALEEYYRGVDKYARQDHDEDEDDGINSTETRPGGRMTPEERKEIKEKLNRNWEGTTNYAGMYREKNGYTEGKLAEAQRPLDQGEPGEEDPEDEELSTPEEDAFDDHQKNKNRSPKIISADVYSELPAHIDKKVLYLYAYDETVVDEDNDDEPIEDYERLIGDALTKYGFIDNDERIIFVMNYSLDTCYEVQKVDASWSDTH